MPFAVPMVWRETSNHSSDWYFCLTPPVASGIIRKEQKLTIQIYPLPSDLCLMGKICPCRSHQKNKVWIRRWKRKTRRRTYRSRLPKFSIWDTSWTYTKRTEWSSTRFGAAKGKGRTASIQNETMEIFGWRLENNFVSLSPKNLEEFFTMEGTLVACKDVDGLLKALNMSHCSDKWGYS